MTPDCLPGGAGEADVDEAGVELQLGEHRAQVRLVVLPGEGGQPAGGQVHDVFSPPVLRLPKDFFAGATSARARCRSPTDRWSSPVLVFAVTGAARLLRPAAAGGLKHLRSSELPGRPTGAPRGNWGPHPRFT